MPNTKEWLAISDQQIKRYTSAFVDQVYDAL